MQIENMEKEWVRKTDIIKQKRVVLSDDDDDEVPLHEQLENANK
jgi:hypothetical protein